MTKSNTLPEPVERVPPTRVPRRLRVAEGLAVVALIAAFVGALGPAGETRTTYAWPPLALPDKAPTRLWYTPLLLAARIPARIEARIPCAPLVALPRASRPLTVFATARAPERAGGLSVTGEGEGLTLKVGSTELARLPDSRAGFGVANCSYHLEIASGSWSLEGGRTGRRLEGQLEEMPVVNGLFSGVDLRSAAHPAVTVTTSPHRVVTSGRQSLAWTVAALCALAALLFVALARPPARTWSRFARVLRGAVSSASLADAAIAALLLVWWVLAPALFDDGWTIARQTAFETTSGFSQYYESFGVSLPLGYWLEWMQHWVTRSTDALVLLRIPALFCLAATWVLCRWMLAQLVRPTPSGRSVVVWALAASFAAMAMAWGMTLRQEPTVALLVAGAMACCIRFAHTQSVGSLALVALLLPLAVTAHPTGLVALAPLFAIAAVAFRWARSQPASAVALLTASGALLLTLAFVGSDVEQRADDARTLSAVSTTVVDWRDELVRYTYLTRPDEDGITGYGTPLRRGSAALMLLAALAFLGRARGERRADLDVPALTLLIALVLLVTTPSKWPWHLGTLTAIAAVAVATETARIRDGRGATRWRLRSFVAIGALVIAIAWSWSPRGAWNVLDLRTLDWTPAVESLLPFSRLAIALPLVLVAGGMFYAWRRGRTPRDVPSRVASWSAPILALPLMAFTLGVLAVDAARTADWTTARANVEALRGERGCGVAGELVVPVLDSASPLPTLAPGRTTPTPGWVPAAPTRALARWALGPTDTTTSTLWFSVSPDQRPGIFVSGRPTVTDRLEVEWGKAGNRRVTTLGEVPMEISPVSEGTASLPWRFVSSGELGAPPSGANVMRVTLRSNDRSRSAVAVTAPVEYANETLERRLRQEGSRPLTMPNVLTFLPCAALPRLEDGVVEVPRTLVTTRDSVAPVQYVDSSPFAGLLDLYDLERLPLADSDNPPRSVVVFGVDRRIPGAAIAPPDRVTAAS